ncbi:MAG: hypothetical protein DME97_13065 [Verrucomicrobia bacterium]|nr:MAG: hypothetical protein DME97_13065 [Verrucomicrobiota bacterium]
MLRILILITLVTVGELAAEQIPLSSAKNWEVRGAAGKITWVELHNIDPSDSAVIHVEVLSRKKTDDPSEVKHLQAHVAITVEALQRSVVRPLRDKRGVYPESFDYGYKHWKEEDAAGKRVVCTTRE